MKILSSIYLNQKINIFGSIVNFENGKAEIEEDLYSKIKQAEFPGIRIEGEIDIENLSTDSKDEKATLKEISESYMEEIDRLKRTIVQKDQLISEAKQEAQSWRDLCDQLKKDKSSKKSKDTKSEAKETVKGINEEIEEIRKELEIMSFEDLKNLASEEGVESVLIESAGEDQKKLVDIVLNFYTKK